MSNTNLVKLNVTLSFGVTLILLFEFCNLRMLIEGLQMSYVHVVILLHPEASVEATHIISAISEVPSVPAPCDTEATVKGTQTSFGLVFSACQHDFL